ncbi:MAG: tautomerase family protein [Sporichthyaceae bacterium]
MPFWKIYTPVGAYTPAEKQELCEKITHLHDIAPIPHFYVVILFEEVDANSLFVGGKPNGNFVRFKIDHMARSMPDAGMRRLWLDTIGLTIAPFVKDRGYDWEITIGEMPIDFWIMNGEVPPPPASVAERRWFEQDKVTPYSIQDTAPHDGVFHGLHRGIQVGH